MFFDKTNVGCHKNREQKIWKGTKKLNQYMNLNKGRLSHQGKVFWAK